MEVLKFKKNEVIFKEGDFEPWMFDIRWGKVGIYTGYGTADEKLLTTLENGQFFGEMGLVDYRPRSGTAVALENDTQLQKIDMDTFYKYFSDKPEKLLAIMQQMSHRIRELTKDYMDVCKAAYESVEEEKDEKKKSTMKQKLKKFLDDYAYALSISAEDGFYNPHM